MFRRGCGAADRDAILFSAGVWREIAWLRRRVCLQENLRHRPRLACISNWKKQRMKVEPPSSFNQHIFFEAKSVFYGTDDGYQDGSGTEFQQFEEFYNSVASGRRENIHLVSAVGEIGRAHV